MRRLTSPFYLLAATGLCGCAATMHSGMVATDSPAATIVDGIPYRMPERLVVEVYRMTDKGYQRVGQQLQTLPDPTKLYVMNFSGQMLADASLKVEQRQDGTLSTVRLAGASKADAAANSVASGLEALQAAHATIEAAKKSEAENAEKAATSEKTKAAAATQAIYDALATKDAVTQLELTLSDTRNNLKPSEIFALESQIRQAKLKANTAAVAVGQPIPYPNPTE